MESIFRRYTTENYTAVMFRMLCCQRNLRVPRGLYFHLSMLFHAMFQTSGGLCSFENNELLRSRKTAERTRVHQQWSPQDRARDFQDKRVFIVC